MEISAMYITYTFKQSVPKKLMLFYTTGSKPMNIEIQRTIARCENCSYYAVDIIKCEEIE